MTFPPAHFIAKFSAIPDEQWTVRVFQDGNAFCALGHCGKDAPEANALIRLFCRHKLVVTDVNDAGLNINGDLMFPQSTPKARMLAALHWIVEEEGKP